MFNLKRLNLQLFAEGGEGGGEGAATGESAGDPGQRLLELGVPAEKIRKRQKAAPATKLPEGAVKQKAAEPVAGAETTEETKTEETKAPRMSWDEIKADPEYSKRYDEEMQNAVKTRLKSAKGAEETLSKMDPIMEVLSRKYNLDAQSPTFHDDLVKAVNDDNAYYEDKAIEMGVPIETAKKIDQQEREEARRQREETRTLEQQKIQQHIQSLEQQSEAMKQAFPNFDLRKELQNPAFARMTSPGVGLSVEDAYYAVHRKEIQAAAMQVTAQKTAQKISNSIQAGQRRPAENGTSGQAASVTTFDYRNASREQKEELKRQIRAAAARGEKIYPGR